MLKGRYFLLATTAMLAAVPAHGQQATPPAADAGTASEPNSDDDIVVTAVARGQNRLDSSVSVSSLNADAIANAAPRSVAELFPQPAGHPLRIVRRRG